MQLITPTISHGFEAMITMSSFLAEIDLTGTEYVWIDMEEIKERDYLIEIDFLNQKLNEKKEIISELEFQTERNKKEIDEYKKEISGFDKLNQNIRSRNEIISKLNKKISTYKERLDRFTIDSSLPEGYYGNEEYNE